MMTNTFDFNNWTIKYPIDLNYVHSWFKFLVEPQLDYNLKLNLMCLMLQSTARLKFNYDFKGSRCLISYDELNNCLQPDNSSWFDCIEQANFFDDLILHEIDNNNQDFINLYDKSLKYVASLKKKRQRLKRFIKNYCFLDDRLCYFITYTFSDEALKKPLDLRRKQVINELKSISGVIAFALNIDYGDLNDREHFHIVLSTRNRIDFSQFSSNIDFELCKTGVKDKEAISKYIAKLSNHGVKHSTKNTRIYYYKSKNNK